MTSQTEPRAQNLRGARAAVMLLLSSAALGDEQQPTPKRAEDARFYAGLGAATLTYEGAYGGIAFEDSALGLGLYGGFRLRDNLSIEVSYSSVDAVNLDDLWGSGTARLDVASDWETTSVKAVGELSLKEWLNFPRNWRVYGALGGYQSDVDHSVTTRATGAVEIVRADEAGLMVGAGVLYEVGIVDVRGYVEWFGVLDEGEAWDAGVAVQVRF